MMITLSRLYRDGVEARAVVDELKATGLPEGDIGIIAPSQSRLRGRDARTANRSAGVGAALGGAAGLLAGLGAFVLPGIGAVAGGAAGGVVGALIEAGISKRDAAAFAEGVRRGDNLVTIRVASQDRDFYQRILAGIRQP